MGTWSCDKEEEILSRSFGFKIFKLNKKKKKRNLSLKNLESSNFGGCKTDAKYRYEGPLSKLPDNMVLHASSWGIITVGLSNYPARHFRSVHVGETFGRLKHWQEPIKPKSG